MSLALNLAERYAETTGLSGVGQPDEKEMDEE